MAQIVLANIVKLKLYWPML